MNKVKEFFKGRTVGWYLMAATVVIAFVSLLFYAIHSPSNLKTGGESAFDAVFLVFIIFGFAAAVADLILNIKYVDFLAPVAATFFGVAFGIMVADMLPTASDVWNKLTFIGGDFVGYLAYTILSGITAVAAIVATFLGTKNSDK